MKKFMKATCTTLAMIGLCAGSAFAVDFNGDTLNEVGGIGIGPDASSPPAANTIQFQSSTEGTIDFTDSGLIQFGPDIDGFRTEILGDDTGVLTMFAPDAVEALTRESSLYTSNDGCVLLNHHDCFTTPTPPLYAAGIINKKKGAEEGPFGSGPNTSLISTEGMIFVGQTDLHEVNGEVVIGKRQFGMDITDDRCIWTGIGLYEYDGPEPDWYSPSTIDTTKVHYRPVVQNLSAGTSGDPELPDGYAGGSAGRSVYLFSFKEPTVSYNATDDELLPDRPYSPSAELWLHEVKEGEPDDPDARLIAYEGAARVMTRTASTGAVKAELRAESDGDVVIRLGSN